MVGKSTWPVAGAAGQIQRSKTLRYLPVCHRLAMLPDVQCMRLSPVPHRVLLRRHTARLRLIGHIKEDPHAVELSAFRAPQPLLELIDRKVFTPCPHQRQHVESHGCVAVRHLPTPAFGRAGPVTAGSNPPSQFPNLSKGLDRHWNKLRTSPRQGSQLCCRGAVVPLFLVDEWIPSIEVCLEAQF